MGYEFTGELAWDSSGYSVSNAGDVDGDGHDDLLIGAFRADDGGSLSGSTYLINAADLAALDAADGTSDGVINLSYVAATGSSYKFVGEANNDYSGHEVSNAGDVDGDGLDDLLIGAYGSDDGGGADSGSAYLINAADLAALDAADGTTDGVISLGQVAGTGTSYEFVGANAGDGSGVSISSAGDVDGDTHDDLLIGAYGSDDGGTDAGSTYLINADDLAALDAADGTTDGVIDMTYVAATGTSYQFVGEGAGDISGISVSSAGDVDNDGLGDLLIGAYWADDGADVNIGLSYLVNAADLAALDAADGTADGVIELGQVAGTGSSYRFVGEDAGDESGYAVSSAGDVDGDNNDDLLISTHLADDGGTDSGSTYLINADDLATLDAADGTTDGVIDLTHVAGTGTSYEFVGADAGDDSGISISSAGDVDNDGLDDLLIGAQFTDDGGTRSGTTYLINANDLAALDAADGTADGVIDLTHVAATGTSYAFVGEFDEDNSGRSVSNAGDVDNDGLDDLLIGAPYGGAADNGSSYYVQSSQLATLDAADGTTDGVIDLANVFCFAQGTEIATPDGNVAVEALRIGDLVLTDDSRAVPVKWIGRQTIHTRFGPAERLMPVRIKAGALGAGSPHTDLTVTADHGMLVDGVICHAGALVNGQTIIRVPLAEMGESYTVYHIETEAHEIILANGAPAETFIDNVSRRVFDNFAEFEALYGDVPEMEELPYPRAMSARQVPTTIRLQLAMNKSA